MGETNADIFRYQGKVTGDSPELGCGTDCHDFAHFKESVALHIAITYSLPIGHPKRFGFGTQKEAWSTMMMRCWEVAPTSEQIVSDFAKYPDILQKIVDANGCVVDDFRLRSGRRYEPLRPGLNREIQKPKLKDRIETLKEPLLHRDALEYYDSITYFPEDFECRLNDIMELVNAGIDEEDLNYSDNEL